MGPRVLRSFRGARTHAGRTIGPDMLRTPTFHALSFATLALVVACTGCGGGGGKISALPAAPAKIELTSAAFADGAPIPVRYTCDGADRSPPLDWGGVPKGTSSLALIVADPDAPGGTFVHWTLFDLDPELTKIAERAVP